MRRRIRKALAVGLLELLTEPTTWVLLLFGMWAGKMLVEAAYVR